MPYPTTRPAADPLDDIDREASGVDAAMARQDRADLPGERSDEPDSGKNASGDVYIDATRVVSEQSLDADSQAPDEDIDLDRIAEAEPDSDIDLARDNLAPAEAGLGADDDDPIDETERAGDDSIR